MRCSAMASSRWSVSRSRVHRKWIAASATLGLFSISSSIARCGRAMACTADGRGAGRALAAVEGGDIAEDAAGSRMREGELASVAGQDRQANAALQHQIDSRPASPREKIIWSGSKSTRRMRAAMADTVRLGQRAEQGALGQATRQLRAAPWACDPADLCLIAPWLIMQGRRALCRARKEKSPLIDEHRAIAGATLRWVGNLRQILTRGRSRCTLCRQRAAAAASRRDGRRSGGKP